MVDEVQNVGDREMFTRRLGLYYFLALATIALTIILSQVLIQRHISSQELDSHVINMAGRQRMLSQKITKLGLKIASFSNRNINGQKAYKELKEALQLWQASHIYLSGEKVKNSSLNKANYQKLQPLFDTILKSGMVIVDNAFDSTNTFQAHVDNILHTEAAYLNLMDRIVLQYQQDAEEKIKILRKTEYIILFVTLILILAELLFIFRPLIVQTKRTIEMLSASEQNATNMASQINKLYTELGKSYQDLEAVNIKPENHSIFLKMSLDGNIQYLSGVFRRLFGFEADSIPKNLKTWLAEEGYEKTFISGLFKMLTEGRSWNGEVKFTSEEGDFLFLDVFMTVALSGQMENPEVLVVARNVTDLKEAHHRSREINLEKIEKSVKEQQYRSVLILEGQEEERKRIAREMHDGIGQMLTALKINMEAITPSSSVHTRKRIEDTRQLLKKVLQEVRRVSFNLMPSSLIDFGIVPALRKFCTEISSLADEEVIFVNNSNFINRLDKNIETNLYRIVQEAVNNAIKYSKASTIVVSLEHSYDDLTIEVSDNGVGFDYEGKKNSGHFGKSGHGIFNMAERAGFIGAKFDVDTSPGHGTAIKITLSVID